MNAPNEDGNPIDNMELLKQQASTCGPGCGCHTGSTPGKARWVIGTIVLVAAGVLVVHAITKRDNASTAQAPAPDFAAPVAAAAEAVEPSPAPKATAAAQAVETTVGTVIGAFAELNTAAAQTDAVFVFLPGREGDPSAPPSAAMKSAAQTIQSRAGMNCGLFTLKAGTQDYDQIAKQMSVPGVVTLVKGRGMSAVGGDVTVAKLIQGFVAAANAGGGCGSSCGPAAAGCR